MDAKISRRLTAKESQIIADIEEKASKRPHKPRYNPMFIINHMCETFKNWNYDEKEDAIDMMESIFTVARKCKLMTEKEIVKERKYMMNEYVDNWFVDE